MKKRRKKPSKKKATLKRRWTPFQSAPSGDPRIDAQPGYVGTFVNSLYQVQINRFQSAWGEMLWLAIIERDRGTRHDWRDLQRVKNELCGPEREAVEVYPAESRLVDTNNQWHLFVFPEGMTVPLGYCERDVSDTVNRSSCAHKQRPFEIPPEGLNERSDSDIIAVYALPEEKSA